MSRETHFIPNPTQLKGRERALKINEGEWIGKAEMETREKFMALNGEHLSALGLNTRALDFCVRSIPLRVGERQV